MTCPICGKTMLSEWPHRHDDPDGTHVYHVPDRDPLNAIPPDPPRRSGCLSVLPWLALILVWVLW